MLLADTEAQDEYFAERYFKGDSKKFHDKCAQSIDSTRKYLGRIARNYTFGSFKSNSFFGTFGAERFKTIQHGYNSDLRERYQRGELGRIDQDVLARSGLYRKLYRDKSSDHNFLAERTLRTMAQYLTLGRLIGADPQSLIVVHDTVNGGFFQQSSKYSNGVEDKSVESPPIIRKDIRVY